MMIDDDYHQVVVTISQYSTNHHVTTDDWQQRWVFITAGKAFDGFKLLTGWNSCVKLLVPGKADSTPQKMNWNVHGDTTSSKRTFKCHNETKKSFKHNYCMQTSWLTFMCANWPTLSDSLYSTHNLSTKTSNMALIVVTWWMSSSLSCRTTDKPPINWEVTRGNCCTCQ